MLLLNAIQIIILDYGFILHAISVILLGSILDAIYVVRFFFV